MRKRIVVFHMLPSGGGIRVAGNFARGISAKHDLTVHSISGASRLPVEGIRTVYHNFSAWRKVPGLLRPAAPFILPLRLLLFDSFCRDLAAELNPMADSFLVHNSMPIAAPPILNYLRKPTLYFCYEYPRHIYEKDLIQRTGSKTWDSLLIPLEILEKRMDIRATLAADAVATLSSYMDRRISSIYGRTTEVIRPGVDTDFFCPDNSSGKGNFVLSVGALWPFKGHSEALYIVSGIPRHRRPELKIVADREFPGHLGELQRLAEGLSVKMSVHRGITDLGLRDLYRSARAVLCCQRREPYGLVPLEAMACGTPVIALSEGGFMDNIRNGVTGLLYSGETSQATSLLEGVLNGGHTDIPVEGRRFVCSSRNIESGLETLLPLLEAL